MKNKNTIKLLQKIKNFPEVDDKIFESILQSYELSLEEFQNNIENIDKLKDETIEDFLNEFKSDKKSFFTICSSNNFNDLTTKSNNFIDKTMIYTPLNDHSRPYLKKGDILFCYRQGQFSSLKEALNKRGIYGIGIASTNPLELYPNEDKHKKYGVFISFPIELNKHLELRNIQLHPKTIDLTPYNGNRNDALQYIEDDKHYLTLLGLLIKKNPEIGDQLEHFLDKSIRESILPDDYWMDIPKQELKLTENESFLLSKFNKDIKDSGIIYNNNLVKRFVASLLTKNFVLLTGLSGSGKTQLAKVFAQWISIKKDKYYSLLNSALKLDKIKETYDIKKVSMDLIEVINKNGSSGKTIPIPTRVVFEWYDCLVKGTIKPDNDPKIIKDLVYNTSSYQKYIQGFYNELFKFSSAMYEINKEVNLSDDNSFVILPVGADWTNREPLLGYPSALEPGKYVKPDNGVLDLLISAEENPDIPFFLILDEMNLSHVERYFADFLSVMESGEAIPLHSFNEGMETDDGTKIPAEIRLNNNVFIIGTVNIDETTYMFSPKVLDRAGVIEFRVSSDEITTFFKNPIKPDFNKILGSGNTMARDFFTKAKLVEKEFEDKDVIAIELINFFNELKKLGAEFGYRTASEIFRYVSKVKLLENNDDEKWSTKEIIDTAVLQKLLPKIHGSRRKLEPVLKEMMILCLHDKNNLEELIRDEVKNIYSNDNRVKYPLSFEKLIRMHNRLALDGFTSFAEA